MFLSLYTWTLLLSLYALICNFIRWGPAGCWGSPRFRPVHSEAHFTNPKHSIAPFCPCIPSVCDIMFSMIQHRFVGNNFHFYTFPYCYFMFFLAVFYKQLKTTTTPRGNRLAEKISHTSFVGSSFCFKWCCFILKDIFSDSIVKKSFYLKQFNAFYNFPLIWFIMFRYVRTMHELWGNKGPHYAVLLIMANCLGSTRNIKVFHDVERRQKSWKSRKFCDEILQTRPCKGVMMFWSHRVYFILQYLFFLKFYKFLLFKFFCFQFIIKFIQSPITTK